MGIKNLANGALLCMLLVVSCAGKQADASATDSASSTPVATATAESTPAEPAALTNDKNTADTSLPAGVRMLLEAYPQSIKGYENGRLIMVGGQKIVYDDGKKKDFQTMLDYSDPEDMFFTQYDSHSLPPEYLADAGRSRSEELFKAMYGGSEAAVRKNLVSVNWFGEKVPFTKVNGASDALRAVADELAVEVKKDPSLKPFLKSSGSFYWRKVRGANRQSAHSYGIAVDVGVSLSDYWLWKNKGASETSKIKYANRIPRKIVDIFERHGFVWGGSWYHYDTMHFEYRPEILKNRKDK